MAEVTREKLMEILKKRFPLMWMKKSEEFSSDYKDCIWTGEGSYIKKDVPMFDNYGNPKYYELDVHNDLIKFLDKYGWYAESYDSGTYFLAKV